MNSVNVCFNIVTVNCVYLRSQNWISIVDQGPNSKTCCVVSWCCRYIISTFDIYQKINTCVLCIKHNSIYVYLGLTIFRRAGPLCSLQRWVDRLAVGGKRERERTACTGVSILQEMSTGTTLNNQDQYVLTYLYFWQYYCIVKMQNGT